MSIRKRLALGFVAILGLLTVNLAGFFFSDRQRSATVEDLRRALDRQLAISEVKQRLNELQKQLALTGQTFDVPANSEGLGPEEIRQFESRLDAVREQIRAIEELTDPLEAELVRDLDESFDKLAHSWMVVYRNYGVDQEKAITEQVMTAEPLSQSLTTGLLPRLEKQERRGVAAAQAKFRRVSWWTERMAILGVAVSVLIAAFVAYRISRHLVHGLEELKLGATRIGEGRLEERIEVRERDEIGGLASAFNEMGERLLVAQQNLTEAHVELEARHREVEEQRKLSESLLRNTLPEEVAAELQAKGAVEPQYFEDVTVFFADIKGFTLSTEKLAAEELVHLLNDYFTAFDEITARYRLEKLKTIGDCYMLVAGCPRRHASHAVDAVLAAFEMLHAVAERDRPEAVVRWQVRIGIHTGPVVAGVVGTHKFAFDIWGDTVNQASRMESSGAPGRINLSSRTYTRVKDFIACEPRGQILTKEKRAREMFFADGILPGLAGVTGEIPPAAFKERYSVYFGADPPSFPAFDLSSIAVEKILFLREVSLFSGLDPQALRQIAEISEAVSYPAGTEIFRAGDASDSAYLIEEGAVRIHLGDRELRVLEKSTYFGEMGLLSDRARSASVTALTDCRLLRITQEGLREILLHYPQAALDIIRRLADYLVQNEGQRQPPVEAEAARAES